MSFEKISAGLAALNPYERPEPEQPEPSDAELVAEIDTKIASLQDHRSQLLGGTDDE